MSGRRGLLTVAVLFLVVRAATVVAYRDTLYYYGMVLSQYAIAQAAYAGHWFAHDPVLSGAALQEAARQKRHIPLEEWKHLQGSGRYATFPAVDLPGYGYVIALTSRWFGERLTTRYALVFQVLLELAGLLLFLHCVSLGYGARTATLAGLVYVFAYVFIWPIASQPMRDVFGLPVYAAFVAAVFAFLKGHGPRSWLLAGLALAVASSLLWLRPYGYYFAAFLVPLVALVSVRSRPSRAGFAAMLLLIPWLVFGYPFRLFNLRHYGTADTDLVGRTLWQHMGIARDNPYGFVLDDGALLPWIKARYGKDVEYASPEMNRLLGDYARSVVRADPAFYFKTVWLSCLEMIKTPLDAVPPFPLVEYSSSGLAPLEYARAHPGAFAYKLFNRVYLAAFFYGGLALALRLALREPRRRLELLLLLSPLVYAALVQAATHFEPRYMATAAWVLVLPIARGFEELFARFRGGGASG